jgi:hypothetical protein
MNDATRAKIRQGEYVEDDALAELLTIASEAWDDAGAERVPDGVTILTKILRELKARREAEA